jgi:Txe/YoeB family toxin of Txe-Axe toxin-antitoxin module
LIHFFKRHPEDDPARSVPGRDFLERCPDTVAAKVLAVLKAVAGAPPPQFSGGGMWEAMHGEMTGYYEVRVDGAGRRHYRLFCLLERQGADTGLGGPSIVILSGKVKPFGTKLAPRDYREVRALGEEYLGCNPRSVVQP